MEILYCGVFQAHIEKTFQKHSSVQALIQSRQNCLRKLADKHVRPIQLVAPRPENPPRVKSPLFSPKHGMRQCNIHFGPNYPQYFAAMSSHNLIYSYFFTRKCFLSRQHYCHVHHIATVQKLIKALLKVDCIVLITGNITLAIMYSTYTNAQMHFFPNKSPWIMQTSWGVVK